MAELSPWEEAASVKPAEVMPWEEAAKEEKPGIVKDMAKTVAPSLLRGSLAAITTPRTVSDMTGAGVNWLANKVAPQSVADAANKFHNWDSGIGKAFPSYEETKGDLEKEVTGPLYEAKRAPGKILQTGLEVAPSLLAGGEGALPTIVKALGAGIGSEGAGEAAHAASDYLPSWAEPVARGAGALLGGTFGPSTARRAVTPLPMSAEQTATVAALKADHPELVNASTAGQLTGSPKLMDMESRTGLGRNAADKQNTAFTEGTMKKMGVDGLATPENIAKGTQIGKDIGDIRRSNAINSTEFPRLNTEISQIVRKHTGTVGKEDAKVIADIQKEIKMGAANNSTVMSMPGARYDYLRQKLQTSIEGAGTGTENKAISDIRSKLDEAFHRSIPADESARLKELEKQYVNYNVIKNLPKESGDVITPKELRSGMKRQDVNTNKGELAPWANNAEKVMVEHAPTPDKSKVPPMVDLGLASLSGLLHGGAAHHYGGGAAGIMGLGEGSVLGHLLAPSIYHGVADIGAHAVSNRASQAYLKNQLWKPGQASSTDLSTLVKLLASPEGQAALPGQ